MENIGNLQNKMKLLFEKISEPNYVLNVYYSDNFLNKLKSNDADIKNLLKLPYLSELILKALQNINTAHHTVQVFIMRLLAILVNSELHFIKIFAKEGDKICKMFHAIAESATSPSSTVAILEVGLALTTHNSGVTWLLENKIWKLVSKLCYDSKTVFILRQTYKFIGDLLWKLSDDKEESSLIQILDHILEPLRNKEYSQINILSSDEENEIIKRIEPIIKVVLMILNYKTKIQGPNMLIHLLVKNYNLKSVLTPFIFFIHKDETTHLIAKTVMLLLFAHLFLTKPANSSEYTPQDFLVISVTYFNTLEFFVKRRNPVPIMDYCNMCCSVWFDIWPEKKYPVLRNGEFNLEKQLIFILLVPVTVFLKRSNYCLNDDDPLDQYILKLLNNGCEHAYKAAHSIKRLMNENGAQEMTLNCVKRLSCLKNHLNNTGANLIFQALYYVLENYVPLEESGEFVEEMNIEEMSVKNLIMSYVLDILYWLVKNHDINWHQSIEILTLYKQVHHILRIKNLSCKFIVSALNLITILIKKFLPPTLSLLLDSKPGATIHELGQLIYSKLHDQNWEVRDSALELLLVCTEISYMKYTPFQNQIIDNNLIVVAGTVGLNDSEFYVQASALRCLGAATKVTTIWEQLVQHFPNIQERLLILLYKNPEGIVRKEIVGVLCEVYLNIKLSPSYKIKLYEHMVSTAIIDFHWEVQLAAIQFWRIAIEQILSDQGMLDGVFPSVTFSKETRKIVMLNDREIQKRLKKSIEDLAHIGCLTVFIKLMDEDGDVEIMECIFNSYHCIFNMLQKYKIHEILDGNTNPSLTDDLSDIMDSNSECHSSDECEMDGVDMASDTIIESILNSKDINLLSTIYQSHMNLQKEAPIEDLEGPKVKPRKQASPKLFIDYFASKDFKSIIENKIKWREGIRSVSSLLDDMTGIYEYTDEVNSLDCY